MKRNGKIAQLPREIRSKLSQRLHDGERGQPLLDWLNGLPEVREFLNQRFGGRPINAENLSAWRQGGYQNWITERTAFRLAVEEMKQMVMRAEGDFQEAPIGGSTELPGLGPDPSNLLLSLLKGFKAEIQADSRCTPPKIKVAGSN